MSQGRNVLIVGGAGYIGSHTTLSLNAAGYETVVYDNFSSGHRDACFADKVVEGDLSDTAKLAKTMKDNKIGCVIHFAALIEAGQSVVTPLPFYENNVAGTLSLLNAMNHAEVRRIVFSSTAASYGNNVGAGLLSEDLLRAPINPYGDSKVMVEMMLEACAEAHGFEAVALRYFNAAGADPAGRTGERHDPETHLIPLIIQAARGERANIKIYGTDYDTPDGTCIRDYIHVNDLASGHIAAVKHLAETTKPGLRIINLGTGEGRSVREVVQAVKDVSGVDFEVIEQARRPGDPARLVADVRKAKEVLGWTATHSSIEQIVIDAWNYAERQSRA